MATKVALVNFHGAANDTCWQRTVKCGYTILAFPPFATCDSATCYGVGKAPSRVKIMRDKEEQHTEENKILEISNKERDLYSFPRSFVVNLNF
jgi:hypothetical protein